MHTFPVQIRFNDIDTLGHINNVIYGHYFDMARCDFLMQKFGDLFDVRQNRFILIMVHTEYNFLLPSFFGDRLHVETSILRIGGKSIHFTQQVADDKGVVRVTSLSVMSSYDKESGTSFEISAEWRAALASTP